MTEATSISQVATSPVVTNVFEQILEAVHRGELKPGQRISDADLAEQFGVSRTPVREALVRLREIGIIEASASRFTRVAVVSPRQMVQALIVWAALYDALIDETVPSAQPEWADELERLHQQFVDARARQEGEAVATANYLFYDVLVRRSSNPALQRSLIGVVHIVRLGTPYLPDFIDDDTMANAQQRFIEAVRTRDAAAARDSLEVIRTLVVPTA